MEEEFPLIDCLESNSFSDVTWLLGNRKDEISIYVKAARLCADSVRHIKNTYAAADAADAADAKEEQKQKNKQFLREAILMFESTKGI